MAALLTGCLASNGLTYESIATTNQYHLAKVRKGMSETQVLQIMHKPYSYESFQAEGDIYDVWFYVTWPTGLDQTRMVAQNLTPLTFKNGILVGTGYSWYYYAMKTQSMELEETQPKSPQHPSQDAEDEAFEEALKAPNKGKETSVEGKGEPASPSKDVMPEHNPSSAQEKAPPSEKKLPPNVHIISESDGITGLEEGAQSSPPKLIKPYLAAKTALGITRKEFAQVRTRMNPEQVTRKLGSPDNQESILVENEMYIVWFYKVNFRKKEPQYLPVIFENGKVIGTDMQAYNAVRKKAGQESIDCYTPEAERMQEDASDQNFNYW
ncbi:MAG: hypothetical protein A3I67_02965 [Chlamydiae bacterium RIFCSPLOWO2_02_FULL_45_22]|nr:MAG: hypothetical protein A3I67_02965 [Chlamydiae bacterium RIFCSPLOWO2_02_FULL_45_22]